MNLYVYSLGKTLYEGTTDSITLPTESGEITVLGHHIPLITALAKGTITVRGTDMGAQTFAVRGGFAEVKKDKVIVLAD